MKIYQFIAFLFLKHIAQKVIYLNLTNLEQNLMSESFF